MIRLSNKERLNRISWMRPSPFKRLPKHKLTEDQFRLINSTLSRSDEHSDEELENNLIYMWIINHDFCLEIDTEQNGGNLDAIWCIHADPEDLIKLILVLP